MRDPALNAVSTTPMNTLLLELHTNAIFNTNTH